GLYAPNFRAVADSSHYSEPAIEPFYQLVGVVTSQNARGMGIGAKLLGHQLEILDAKGIPTYLEASTPYNGGGIYGKFGYQPVGELMHFAKNAVLYPLYRPAKKKSVMEFGGYDWLVLEEEADNYLLISKDVLEPAIYHEKFEPVLWNECSIRKYLNDVFLGTFSKAERERILESPFKVDGNPWFSTATGGMSIDPVFLLSVEEVIQYFGDSGQLKNPTNPFEIDDSFNEERAATLPDGTPARWLLRTPGKTSDFTCTVTNGGKISISGDFVNRASTPLFQVGIRPAIRLKKEGDAKNDFNQPFWA
ncbi:MAG: DUF6273 domain-containing protein, partial [Turicibacter sp.]|nr:DUF6273 domain-containing protein [Turicibacter sp.]